jgi:hypothetical protein
MSETTKIESKIEETTEMEVKKPYTFRTLSSPDVFPMFKIISKIGLNEFTTCFEKDGIKNFISNIMGKTEDNEDVETNVEMLGISVALEVANVIFGNLPKCESDIYQLLSQTSNLSIDEIKGLDFATFTGMVIDFIKKEEFKDFIGVVSKLFK